MKNFLFTKIEFHGLNKHYQASLSEDEVCGILSAAGYNEEEIPDLLIAIQDPEHPRNEEMQRVLSLSEGLDGSWQFIEDDVWTMEAEDYEIEVALVGVEDSDSPEHKTLH